MTSQKTISEFLSSDYKDYSLYVLENRAIASVIDGLKPVQRKILHVANNTWRTGSEKALKVFQLSGKVASEAYYHHGDSGLSSAIINLAQSFKNNLPLLEEDGQFGSLRVPEPGAPRYIGTKLHKNFRLIYHDFDLLNSKLEEGEIIEPDYFLPVVPMILVNGSSGIAVGFSSNIINRNPLDVIVACENVIKDKKIGEVKPQIPHFNGDFVNDSVNPKKWSCFGKILRVNTTTLRVIELPPSMTFEKYENILDDLVDKKKIVSYDNNCKDSIDYVIKMTRESLSTTTDEELVRMLKLEEYKTEIYSTLDENGKLKIFENVDDLITYFVKFRILFYEKRKQKIIDNLEKDIKVLSNKAKFIGYIINQTLEVRNIAKSILIKQLEELSFDKIPDSYDYLLRMPIWSLTKELWEQIQKELQDVYQELEKIKIVDPKDIYLKDLQELKKKFK